jgi:hypothetical protein
MFLDISEQLQAYLAVAAAAILIAGVQGLDVPTLDIKRQKASKDQIKAAKRLYLATLAILSAYFVLIHLVLYY